MTMSYQFTTKSVTIVLRIGRFLGNPDEAPFPIARVNHANKGLDSLEVMHESPQALWKRVVAALYACQVGSARIQHLRFMSAIDCQFLSLTEDWLFPFELCICMLLSRAECVKLVTVFCALRDIKIQLYHSCEVSD